MYTDCSGVSVCVCGLTAGKCDYVAVILAPEGNTSDTLCTFLSKVLDRFYTSSLPL